MDSDVAAAGGGVDRIAAFVDSYSRRVYPAVLDQHSAASVSSPLGIWLLLAACVGEAEGEHRLELEHALGCSAADAGELLAAFMASPPPSLKAAIAIWVAIRDATPAVADWVRRLPDAVESGYMPTQAQADGWADRNTLGLIESFPLEIDATTRIVLASAIATKVSWQVPFEVVPASEHLGNLSPWRSKVKRLLWDPHSDGRAMIADTISAGRVAVHFAVAEEQLTVISVVAAPQVPRLAVLQAAHEVAAVATGDWQQLACSLFELPLGAGHAWEISERETRTYAAGQRVERIAAASLPAWDVESRIDLEQSQLFASGPALETMRALIGPRPDDMTEAVQSAVASFGRYGFEAAAVTAFGIRTSASRGPDQIGVERSAILRFDRPYVAIAIAGRAAPPQRPGTRFARIPQEREAFDGLPLFTAWVAVPREPEDAPPAR
jgi:Serpin (serine protease inhibitor)